MVILEDTPSYVPVSKTWARRALWAETHWILLDGFETRLDPQGKLVGEPRYFKKQTIPPSVRPEDFLKTKMQMGTMGYQQLLTQFQRLKTRASPSVLRRIEVDLHRKIAYPASNVVVLLVGIPFVLTERRRAGALLGIAISLALSFAFYAVSAFGTALGKGGLLPPLLSVWLANLIFGAVGLFLLRRVV